MNIEMNNHSFEILDCTIRDGGYLNNWDFSINTVKDIVRQLSPTGVNFIEIGFRNTLDKGAKKGSPWLTCSEKLIEQVKPKYPQLKLSVMVDFGKSDPNHFIQASQSAISMVRVAVHRDKILPALGFLNQIKCKGYLTSIQLMGYPQYSDSECKKTISLLRSNPPDYVYIADSYGSLIPEQVRAMVEPLIDIGLFKVGFHAHNNLQLAFANSLEAVKSGVNIIDCTLNGIGRGAGNLPLEVLACYLKTFQPDKWNVHKILELVDFHIKPLEEKYDWGYSLHYMIAGITKCHPYFARDIINEKKYTMGDVFDILDVLGKRNPIGYNSAELEKLLLEFGYDRAHQIPSKQMAHKRMSTSKPAYLNRFSGRKFLVLANGPSLLKHLSEIKRFIEQNNLIVLGANYLADLIVPDYHAFTDKRRFAKYANTVENRSNLLLSYNFSKEFIREYTDRKYEDIVFGEIPTDKMIDYNSGMISDTAYSVSLSLIGVALLMGAGDIYLAGMDGFLSTDENGAVLYYEEADIKVNQSEIQAKHAQAYKVLDAYNEILITVNGEGLKIITSTSYQRYFTPLINFE